MNKVSINRKKWVPLLPEGDPDFGSTVLLLEVSILKAPVSLHQWYGELWIMSGCFKRHLQLKYSIDHLNLAG